MGIDGSAATYNPEYYVLGHLTGFVDTGARRIGSTSQENGVQNVAFENPDGSRAVFAVNTGGGDRTFSITDAGESLSYTLPAGAVATFVWTPGS